MWRVLFVQYSKNRFSSRGNGVTWSLKDVARHGRDWLVQESINIDQELRVYVINGKVYPIGAVRRSKTPGQDTQALSARLLESDEIEFSSRVGDRLSSMSIVGLDIARDFDGMLYLLEVNRSPGFGKFAELTGVNLARFLYGEKF